ncbi:MAG: hypothetical protein AB7U63_03450 [Porticoccaceae bacterium]
MDESLKQPVKGILFDLDGVFYVDDQLIPGAVGCLRRLRKRNIGCRFVTNTTTQSSRELEDKLVGLGIPCRRDELITAPVATANYLRRSGIQRCYFAVKPAVMADFDGFSHTDDQPEAVVVGDIGEAWSIVFWIGSLGLWCPVPAWWPCIATAIGRRLRACMWI